eukprot:GEZU01029575.1.p2 GENE.GEZU01029575.1~~GEZU01029575.1.p2  ORF type:complete len:101 (+),score=26.67 GEZU01029575.1:76-378(+)
MIQQLLQLGSELANLLKVLQSLEFAEELTIDEEEWDVLGAGFGEDSISLRLVHGCQVNLGVLRLLGSQEVLHSSSVLLELEGAGSAGVVENNFLGHFVLE